MYSNYRYQVTQGQLLTLTCNSLDQNGNPVVTDNFIPPSYNLFFESPNGQIQIMTNMLTTPITQTWFYTNIDTTLLSVGSYTAIFSWTIATVINTVTTSFDVLPFDGSTLLLIDPISRLRIRLNDLDIDPTRWVFNDQQLSQFLQDALDDLNAAPAKTNWYWFNVPLIYVQNILRGAEVLAMESMAIKLSHSPISYNDKGLSVNLQQQASTYLNIATNLREKYEAERLRIKRQGSTFATGYIVGGAGSPYLSTPPIRACGRGWGGL